MWQLLVQSISLQILHLQRESKVMLRATHKIWALNPQLIPLGLNLFKVCKEQNHGLTQSWPLHPTPPSVLIKLIYGGNKRPPTQHASLARMPLQLLAVQIATTSQPVTPKSSYEILALLQSRQQFFHTHQSNISHAWHIIRACKFMQLAASCRRVIVSSWVQTSPKELCLAIKN